MSSTPIVIRKYANRRMYDTSESRYVNLEEIAAMVRNGRDVQVLDAATGEDVTRVTLTQIIVDDAREQPTGLPLELLRQLIVTSDRVGQEFILWYLKSAQEAYQKVQNSLQNGLSEMQAAALSPLNVVRNFMQRPTSPTPATESKTEMEHLRQRISELESRLNRSKTTKKAARKGAKRTAKHHESAQ